MYNYKATLWTYIERYYIYYQAGLLRTHAFIRTVCDGYFPINLCFL